jgi:hypothetical protein
VRLKHDPSQAENKQRELLTWLGVNDKKVFNILHFNKASSGTGTSMRRVNMGVSLGSLGSLSRARSYARNDGMTREQRRDAWINRMRQQRSSSTAAHAAAHARATDAANVVNGVRQVRGNALHHSLCGEHDSPLRICYGVRCGSAKERLGRS